MSDVLPGQMDTSTEETFSAGPIPRGGTARPLPITGTKRLPLLSDTSITADVGLAVLDFEICNALALSVSKPAPVRATWRAALGAGLEDPEVQLRYSGLMDRVPGQAEVTAAQLAARIGADTGRWGDLLRHSSAAKMD
ncbi:hypothetical protein ACFQX4_17660 [Roseomonas sp. GCM10028921]